jgi:hypothetical protein
MPLYSPFSVKHVVGCAAMLMTALILLQARTLSS